MHALFQFWVSAHLSRDWLLRLLFCDCFLLANPLLRIFARIRGEYTGADMAPNR